MKEMVLNIDIAPTFLDIAGVTVPKDMDGTSIMKLFRRKKGGRRSKRYKSAHSSLHVTIPCVQNDLLWCFFKEVLK